MSGFADAVRTGLSAAQKVVPARFLYDARGSELFEAITALPEYYPTRTETAILTERGAEIAAAVGGIDTVVEFGSGSSIKTPLLLGPVRPRAYVPIDIAPAMLAQAADAIGAAFPAMAVRPLAADFTRPLALDGLGRALGFFPGSTIGNLAPAAAVDLLRAFARTLGPGGALVIGIDLRKDAAILEAAYDDAAGVTAAFNLNLLDRINRELDGTIDVGAFAHRARWEPFRGRVEMHLEALHDVAFEAAGARFGMRAGETIHTENSHKFYAEELRFMARAGGFEPVKAWMDPRGWFSVHLWATARDEPQP